MKFQYYFYAILSLVAVSLSAIVPRVLHAQDSFQFSTELIERLAQDPQWRALLHYDSVLPFWRESSRSRPSPFFLSVKGAYDAQAELDATLTAFLSSELIDDSHAVCRFPARFHWLRSQIPELRTKVVENHCPQLESWYRELQPEVVTLIFPASFLNNPASAFGHTFIRLDRREQNEQTRLLASSADFAAVTSGEDALTYAAKGIFGGYNGVYSVMPYHKKITKYSELENRDIWEYQLGFTADEVKLLTLHLWELRNIPFTYYYFDENCSYHVLALLQVARPSLPLVDAFYGWVLPVDTVREVFEYPGLVTEQIYRPSAATKLKYKISQASFEARSAALELSHHVSPSEGFEELSTTDKIDAVDIAYEYQTYERIRTRDESDKAKSDAWSLLRLRSTLKGASRPAMPTPAVRPEQGHRTSMVGVGAGSFDNKWGSEFTFRPTLHALVDRSAGYIPGSQIKFLESVIRADQDDIDLERLTALEITSLTPRDDFFKPRSWEIRVEARRLQRSERDEPLVGALEGGMGRSYQLSEALLGYGLLNLNSEISGALEQNYALGGGAMMGVTGEITELYGVDLGVRFTRYALGEEYSRTGARFAHRLSLSMDDALVLESRYGYEFNRPEWSNSLRYERSF